MRKIGGVNMDTIARLTHKLTKEKDDKRYCTVYESLEQSIRKMKLHQEERLHLDTWGEYLAKKRENKE